MMDALGGIISAGINAASNQVDNALNWVQTEKNRAFQAKMSNSSHQREVADLRAAGLNPILSANAGASAPTGGVIPMSGTSDSISKGISSALAVSRFQKETNLLDAQAANQRSQAEKTAKEAAIVPIATPKTVIGESINAAKNYGAKLKSDWDAAKSGRYKPWWEKSEMPWNSRLFLDSSGESVFSPSYAPSSAKGYVPVTPKSSPRFALPPNTYFDQQRFNNGGW